MGLFKEPGLQTPLGRALYSPVSTMGMVPACSWHRGIIGHLSMPAYILWGQSPGCS